MEKEIINSKNKNLKFYLKSEIFPLSLIVLTIFISLFAYNDLPEKVATHWNFAGEADAWSSKLFHSLFFPGIIISLYLLFVFLPKLDPRKDRYKEFFNVYLIFRNLIILLMFTIFSVATLANLGYSVNITLITSISIGLLMIVIGNYLGKIKRNWFVGIKTPWTLSSENSWNKTHRLGGKLFIIWGILIILSPWLPLKNPMITIILGLLPLIISITIYSYLVYKKELKK